MSRATDHANSIYGSAALIHTGLNAALNALHNNLAGYPNHTPGAPPATGPTTTSSDDPIPLTPVEQQATTRDPAATDLERLLNALYLAEPYLRTAAFIVNRWSGHTATLAANLNQFCDNHTNHGINGVPRADKRTVCTWCHAFKVDHQHTDTAGKRSQRYPTARILDAQQRGVPAFVLARIIRDEGFVARNTKKATNEHHH